MQHPHRSSNCPVPVSGDPGFFDASVLVRVNPVKGKSICMITAGLVTVIFLLAFPGAWENAFCSERDLYASDTLWVASEIVFDGAKKIHRDELLSASGLCELNFSVILGGRECPVITRNRLDRASVMLRTLYVMQGFADASVSRPDLNPTNRIFQLKGRFIRKFKVTFHIEEGERTFIDEVYLFGLSGTEKRNALKKVSSNAGEPFNPRKIDSDVKALIAYFRDKGFYNVDVRNEIISSGRGKVQIAYSVKKGYRFTIGNIKVSGNTDTRSTFIKKVVSMKHGELYNEEKLEKSRRRLYELGLFSRVSIIGSVPDTTNPVLDLNIVVRERKLRWYSFGLGGSSREQEHFRALVEWGDKNFLGTGRRLSLRTLGGFRFLFFTDDGNGGVEFVRNENNIVFTDPYLFNNPVTGSVEIFHIIEVPPEESDVDKVINMGVNTLIRREIGNFTTVMLSGELDWINEKSLVGTEGTSGEYKNTRAMELNFERDIRNNPFEPWKGALFTAGIKHAGGLLGGDYLYRRYTMSFSVYRPVGGSSRLAARIAGGYIELYSPGHRDVPRTDRFFLGGASTVRGYREEELGSGIENYEGGRVMALAGLEYRFNITGKFDGAVFFDAGQVWGDLASVSIPGDLCFTLGPGFRYRTAIGPVRLDYGLRLNGERGGRLHFSIGNAF